MHLVLLGDSTIDNGAYVGAGEDVHAQLCGMLEPGSTATSLAFDGSMVADIARQMERIPAGATHLAISIGGNDALDHAAILELPVSSVSEAVAKLAKVQSRFANAYRVMLEGALATGCRIAVATIYGANFEPPRGDIIRTAGSVFNDAIFRHAFALGVDLIDLRLICSEPTDYANPIEPSAVGGRKIARALASFAGAPAKPSFGSRVFI